MNEQDKMNAFHPGISMAGAVDLSSLQHEVSAVPGQEGGAPAAGDYVVDVTEDSFQSVVEASNSYPVLLLLWMSNDDRFFVYAQTLADAVNQQNGAVQLARIDVQEFPEAMQALRAQGVPSLYALINSSPFPILEGLPELGELQQITDQVIPQIISTAQSAGLTGIASRQLHEDNVGAETEISVPSIPPEHEKAHDLAHQGDYLGAAEEYARILKENPQDELAARERAKALLLARSGDAKVTDVRYRAAENPDDLDAQLAVADIDMIGGQVGDAFARLLDFAAEHSASLDDIRHRLLEYFLICGENDTRVKSARRRIASLLY